MSDDAQTDFLDLTAMIVANHVTNNSVSVGDIPGLIKSVHDTLKGLGQAEVVEAVEEHKPAVSVRSSVKHDRIISLIDGKPYKMLKRHLGQNGLTPKEYRERYGLKDDYPMTAPGYAAQRKELALKIGLGKKRKVAAVSAPKKAPAKRKVAAKASPDSE